MKVRSLPLASAILGVLTLAAFLYLGSSEAVRAVYEPSEVSIAVSAFQRAETISDIIFVFGSPPNPAVIAAMDAVNWPDLYAFIPAYALFLCVVAVMLGGLRNRWTQAAIAFALIGALADSIETYKQIELTSDIDNAERYLPIAPWHWLKYAALALNGVAVASLCITAEHKHWILAVIALLPLPLVAASYAGVLTPRAFAAAFALYWVALLVLSIVENFRKPTASAPAASSPA